MESIDLESIMATVHSLLVAEKMNEAAELVRRYAGRLEQTGYDNWNGGTNIWEIYLEVPPVEYAKIGTKRPIFEEQITSRLKIVLEKETQDWYSVTIIPKKNDKKNWRLEQSALQRHDRLEIINNFIMNDIRWSGALDDVEFLGRLYDLDNLPSQDSRFKNAAGDIWQHRINNDDWEDRWVFHDDRFGLLDGTEDNFLNFLCQMVNPVVRPNREEALWLISNFNEQLRPHQWKIVEEERIAGRPRFVYKKISNHGASAMSRAKTVSDALDASWMAKAIERLESSVDTDPDLAIGTAKELVEACCKTILVKRDIVINKTDDIGDLTKKLSKELNLVPEGVTDEIKGADNIRLILRNLTQLTSNLAQLRGLYGTGHGRDGKYRGLQPRHARLAVASAIAFIDFVSETYRIQELNSSKS